MSKITGLKNKYQAQLDALTKRQQLLRDELTTTAAGIEQYRGAIFALDEADRLQNEESAPTPPAPKPELKVVEAPTAEEAAPTTAPAAEATDGQA